MAEATIRSAAPVLVQGEDGRRHAMTLGSTATSPDVWVLACGASFAGGTPRDGRGPRCIDCLVLVGIEVSINLGAERSVSDDARVFSNSSEHVAACVTIIDLVVEDLRGLSSDGPRDVAIAELMGIRASLHDIAGKLRRAATRFERP